MAAITEERLDINREEASERMPTVYQVPSYQELYRLYLQEKYNSQPLSAIKHEKVEDIDGLQVEAQKDPTIYNPSFYINPINEPLPVFWRFRQMVASARDELRQPGKIIQKVSRMLASFKRRNNNDLFVILREEPYDDQYGTNAIFARLDSRGQLNLLPDTYTLHKKQDVVPQVMPDGDLAFMAVHVSDDNKYWNVLIPSSNPQEVILKGAEAKKGTRFVPYIDKNGSPHFLAILRERLDLGNNQVRSGVYITDLNAAPHYSPAFYLKPNFHWRNYLKQDPQQNEKPFPWHNEAYFNQHTSEVLGNRKNCLMEFAPGEWGGINALFELEDHDGNTSFGFIGHIARMEQVQMLVDGEIKTIDKKHYSIIKGEFTFDEQTGQMKMIEDVKIILAPEDIDQGLERIGEDIQNLRPKALDKNPEETLDVIYPGTPVIAEDETAMWLPLGYRDSQTVFTENPYPFAGRHLKRNSLLNSRFIANARIARQLKTLLQPVPTPIG